jgi:hypothetical protein
MKNPIKEKIFAGLKLILVSIILAFFDSLLRYFIETFGIIEVTPNSIPFYNQNLFKDIIGGWLYLSIFFLWMYAIAAGSFHFIKKKINKRNWFKDWILGYVVCFAFFFAYWLVAESNRIDMLKEGVLVYSVLGIILALSHELLFANSKNK